MRKLAITLAAVAAAGFAAPASAQWYPAPVYAPVPVPPAYGYGYGYGYGHNFGQVRALQVRIDRIQRDLRHLAAYRIISRSEFRNRDEDARSIERRLRRAARFGLAPWEAQDIQLRIARLEYRIARDVHDGRRWAYRWY